MVQAGSGPASRRGRGRRSRSRAPQAPRARRRRGRRRATRDRARAPPAPPRRSPATAPDRLDRGRLLPRGEAAAIGHHHPERADRRHHADRAERHRPVEGAEGEHDGRARSRRRSRASRPLSGSPPTISATTSASTSPTGWLTSSTVRAEIRRLCMPPRKSETPQATLDASAERYPEHGPVAADQAVEAESGGDADGPRARTSTSVQSPSRSTHAVPGGHRPVARVPTRTRNGSRVPGRDGEARRPEGLSVACDRRSPGRETRGRRRPRRGKGASARSLQTGSQVSQPARRSAPPRPRTGSRARRPATAT